jgi:hypothetical protein
MKERRHGSTLLHALLLLLVVTLPNVAAGSSRNAINKQVTSRAQRIPTNLASLSVRGGSSYYAAPTDPYFSNAPPNNVPPPSQYATNDNNSNDQYFEPPSTSATEDADPFHETVQDRLDQWRTAQLENADKYKQSPRDEKGRMKLLTSVGKGSRAAIFFFLMWRDVHLYETAATITSATRRMLLTVPLVFLFIANMAGAVVSLTSPSHATKKRLKAILNLDKVVEVLLVLYAVIRLTVWPSPYTPREVYIGNCLYSALFLLQCQAFTRLSWDENAAQPMSTYSAAAAAAASSSAQSPSPPPTAPARPQSLRNDDWYDPRPNQQTGF